MTSEYMQLLDLWEYIIDLTASIVYRRLLDSPSQCRTPWDRPFSLWICLTDPARLLSQQARKHSPHDSHML